MAEETEPLKHEYRFEAVALNRRNHRKRLQPGELSKAVGVDGRFVGGLRKFAGFNRLTKLGMTGQGICTDGVATFHDMWYVSVRKGPGSSTVLRGFLIYLTKDDAGSTAALVYHYYDPSGPSWHSQEFEDGTDLDLAGDGNDTIDVDGNGRFVYIAIQGQAPQVMYYDSGWQMEDIGPGADYDEIGDTGLPALGAADYTESDTGGYLKEGGTYRVAYRYYDSTRGVFSALSDDLIYECGQNDNNNKLTIDQNPDQADVDRAVTGDYSYDKLYVYRTLTIMTSGMSEDAGVLYLENTYDLDTSGGATDCWTGETVEVGTLPDLSVVMQSVYDPWRDVAGSPPTSGNLVYLNGANFMGNDSDTDTSMRWSQLQENNPEVMPSTYHEFVWDENDGMPLRFVKAGDLMYAFTDNAIYRVARMGSQLDIRRLQDGRSISSRDAVHPLGRDLIGLTDLGVSIYQAQDGSIKTLGAPDRMIFDDWKPNGLTNVQSGADAQGGFSMFYHPSREEAILVWHLTGAVTTLENLRGIQGMCQGPKPDDPSRSRLWLLSDYGHVLYFDDDFSGTGTMYGVESGTTMNGTSAADGGNTTTVKCLSSGEAAHWTTDKLEGMYVYVWLGGNDEAPEARKILSVANNKTLTVASAFSSEPQAGDRWALSPVMFKARAWPVQYDDPPDDFAHKSSTALWVYPAGLSGVTGNANAYWRLGYCRQLEDVPASGHLKALAVSDDVNDSVQHVRVGGHTLEPFVEQIAANLFFELIGLGIDVKIVISRRAAAT